MSDGSQLAACQVCGRGGHGECGGLQDVLRWKVGPKGLEAEAVQVDGCKGWPRGHYVRWAF